MKIEHRDLYHGFGTGVREHPASAPRTTGDGCFKSVVLDFEGNFIEIKA